MLLTCLAPSTAATRFRQPAQLLPPLPLLARGHHPRVPGRPVVHRDQLRRDQLRRDPTRSS